MKNVLKLFDRNDKLMVTAVTDGNTFVLDPPDADANTAASFQLFNANQNGSAVVAAAAILPGAKITLQEDGTKLRLEYSVRCLLLPPGQGPNAPSRFD